MSNKAAWITAPKARPLKVDDAPMPKPEKGEVLIRNRAAAINPVDWKIQETGEYMDKYPFILGCDCAGTIEEVGEGVTGYQKGQRVIGHCPSLSNKDVTQSGFQLYTKCPANIVAAIPSSLSFASASVLPLAISTATVGLYPKEGLGLPYPTVDDKPTPVGRTIIVIGGSSSVGTAAVQLAHASGLTVISTASPKNHSFVKSLGAAEVYDRNDPDIIQKIQDKYSGTDFAGIYDAISLDSTMKLSLDLANALSPSKPTKIVTTLFASEELKQKASQSNAELIAIVAFTLPYKTPAIAQAVWGEFLPRALEAGTFKAVPEAVVVGNGLEKLQEAMDVQREGVSAKKIVVEL